MEQLTLTGAMLKQHGLDRVERSSASFVESMRTIAKGISLMRGEVCMDDLRVAAEQAGLKPEHCNAWGAIFRGPGWTMIGRRPSLVETNHHREIRVWKWEGEGV